MNVYEASITLGIWPMVKARAEVWSVAKPNESVFEDFQDTVKLKYKELMMIHHPDRGGNSNECIKIQKSYEVIKSSTINHIVEALAQEKRTTAKFYRSNSPECISCEKWSIMMGLCMTTTCTGFEQRENSGTTIISSKYKFGERSSRVSDGLCAISG